MSDEDLETIRRSDAGRLRRVAKWASLPLWGLALIGKVYLSGEAMWIPALIGGFFLVAVFPVLIVFALIDLRNHKVDVVLLALVGSVVVALIWDWWTRY